MDDFTLELIEYDLAKIGKEFISTSTDRDMDCVLPKAVGGSKVQLLLGAKNTRIQPVLQLSQFKDIWGSRIIFAGPSKSFMSANKELDSKIVYGIFSA